MHPKLTFQTAVCTDYERLLYECKIALDTWDERREEVVESGLVGKEAGDELLRLQANYAKAYSLLRNHVRNCELCEFVSKFGGRDAERELNAVPVGRVPV